MRAQRVAQLKTFRHIVIDRACTRVFAFINIAGWHVVSNMVGSTRTCSRRKAAGEKHADVVVGVKTAHWEDGPDRRRTRPRSGPPRRQALMVDFGWFRAERLPGMQRMRCCPATRHAPFRAPVPWLDTDGKLY
ncbi:MAG: hypothetical protein HS123_15925 [Solibacteraceae bacterium]|nr:hypothetical protein [Solibacteraceae bacterium]